MKVVRCGGIDYPLRVTLRVLAQFEAKSGRDMLKYAATDDIKGFVGGLNGVLMLLHLAIDKRIVDRVPEYDDFCDNMLNSELPAAITTLGQALSDFFRSEKAESKNEPATA